MAWLETYDNAGLYFRPSIFYKGLLSALSTHNENIIGPACLLAIECYKNSVCTLMLYFQNKEGCDEWPVFPLNTSVALGSPNDKYNETN